jgi:hypothetical protein
LVCRAWNREMHTKLSSETLTDEISCKNYKSGSVRTNVTSRCVRVSTVTVEMQYVLHILSVCVCVALASMQSACALLYCHRQCTYKRNVEVRSRHHCCRGNAISITHSECVCVCVALASMQSACAVLYCHLSPVWLSYCSTLSHSRHNFLEKKVTGHKMCVSVFCTTFV